MPGGYQLGEDAAQRIARAVRRLEASPADDRPQFRTRRRVQTQPFLQWVRITSTTTTAGRYPGVWQSHDEATDTYTDMEACWVRPGPNSEPLQTRRYLCRSAGAESGVPIYVPVPTGLVTRKNSTGTVYGTRQRLNFIEGSNVTITVADDAANDEIDVTIASSASGGVTVAESDGSPSYGSVTTLYFKPSDGFVVTQPGAGQAEIAFVGMSSGIVRATSSTAHAATTGVITFDTEDLDEATFFDSGTQPTRLTAPTNGIYLVTASATVSQSVPATTAATASLEITLSAGFGGASALEHLYNPAAGSATITTTLHISAILSLSAGDYVRFTATGSYNITTSAGRASICRLRNDG